MENKDVQTLHATDYELHTFLYKRSRNPHLVRIMEYITEQFQRIRTQNIDVLNRSLTGGREHL